MPKEMGELQKRWALVMESVRTNNHVVAFMNSRIGQYLDAHPFVALSLLIFMAISAIPVAFFLVFVVATTAVACIALVVMEGFIVSLGGIALLCVLGGLATLSLAVSGALSVCYVSLTTLLSYWPTPDRLSRKEIANGRDCLPCCPPVLAQDSINKNSK